MPSGCWVVLGSRLVVVVCLLRNHHLSAGAFTLTPEDRGEVECDFFIFSMDAIHSAIDKKYHSNGWPDDVCFFQ